MKGSFKKGGGLNNDDNAMFWIPILIQVLNYYLERD